MSEYMYPLFTSRVFRDTHPIWQIYNFTFEQTLHDMYKMEESFSSSLCSHHHRLGVVLPVMPTN